MTAQENLNAAPLTVDEYIALQLTRPEIEALLWQRKDRDLNSAENKLTRALGEGGSQ
jgi:hypothetical protein